VLHVAEVLRTALNSLVGRRITVLGLAFKADTDDERDSLSHKLIRLLERELADVAAHDPVVATPTASLEEVLEGAAAVVVATNHTVVRDAAVLHGIPTSAVVVDPWNCWGAGQVFAYAPELVAGAA